MPRRTRTRQMRRAEALAREEREQEYAELETELHREWRNRPIVSNDEASTSVIESGADTPQPEATVDK